MECFVLNEDGFLIKSLDPNFCQYQVLLKDQDFTNLVEPSFYQENFILGFTVVASIWILSFTARKLIETIRKI